MLSTGKRRYLRGLRVLGDSLPNYSMMSRGATVYTIGYGNRPLDEFFRLLSGFSIGVVSDVRSKPYSGRYPEFSREALQLALREYHIRYVFMGDVLGARPSDPDCYENGRASYSAMARSSAFAQGIERLEIGAEKHRIAIMCAEKDPLDCHRAILISRRLSSDGLHVLHIDAFGKIEEHGRLEGRLLKRYKLDQVSLFEANSTAPLEEAYVRRGHELAYDVLAAYDAG